MREGKESRFGDQYVTRRRGSGGGRLWGGLFVAAGVGLAILFAFSEAARDRLFYVVDLTPPAIRVEPAARPFGPKITFPVIVEDRNEVELAYRLAANAEPVPVSGTTIEIETSGMSEGPGKLTVLARDRSLLGNRSELVVPFELDLTPPRLVTLSDANIWTRQGHTAYVLFQSTEEVTPVGTSFAFVPLGKRTYLLLRPVALEEEVADKTEIFELEDQAGNRARLAQRMHIAATKLPEGKIQLSPAILAKIGAVDFAEQEAMRESNNATIETVAQVVRPNPAFDAKFAMPMPGKWTSPYGERRLYNGEKWHRHLAMDIAHVAGAEIQATANGEVVFADVLGIYGNCVMIDHGYGIVSLYAHMALMEVKVGDVVTAGQRLGTMGATGLAGGEHLHFSILVAGTYVNPDQFFQKMDEVRKAIEPYLAAGQEAAPPGE